MPLVRISLEAGKADAFRAAISSQAYEATRETLAIQEGDRFQIITEHEQGQLMFDANFMGVSRSSGSVVIQIFLSRGRTNEVKQALYLRIAER